MRRNTFRSMVASAGSGLSPSVLALLTRRSRRPSSCTASTSWARCAASATSPGIDTTLVRSASAEAAGSRRSARRASITRVQPRSASASASASPKPCDAPVISATRWFMVNLQTSGEEATTKNKQLLLIFRRRSAANRRECAVPYAAKSRRFDLEDGVAGGDLRELFVGSVGADAGEEHADLHLPVAEVVAQDLDLVGVGDFHGPEDL